MNHRSSRLALAALALGALALGGCARANFISLAGFETDVTLSFETPESIALRVDQVPINRDERVEALVSMFRDVGCDGSRLALESFTGSPTPNVVCTLPGREEGTIVIGAHHVLARGSGGVFDAWTSVALLPALYASVSKLERSYTIQFVGFSSSISKGDASLAFLRADDERRKNVVAMVWLDFLGMSELAAWTERSDPNLFEDFVSAAVSVGAEPRAVRLAGADAIHDQSRAFRLYRIPTIYLHSVDEETKRYLLDPKYDNDSRNIDQAAYYRSYRTLATYVAYLDTSLAARGF